MTGGEQRNIRVVVRVRPNNRQELEANQRTIIKIIDETTLLFDPEEDEDEFYYQGVKQNYRDITKRVNKKLSMEFDRIFDAESTNDDIFVECTKPLVDSVMNGYNCSVFVYGATGAGKTFTMLGNENFPGLTFLTMKELFDRILDLSSTRKFDVAISYLEVYNEQVMNLLTKSGPLKLREDSNGVVVSGLVLTPIHSAEELIRLLIRGNKNRTQHPTDANSESSRSHAIFQVHIRMTEKKTGQKRTVKLSMIDLAGSERAASTKGIGVRFKEGASINKSLLALGNCINKLADGLKHIPYRDSNLTRILKDSLGGNCQTIMIANISPSSLTFEDTYNTLKYASRAKKIRTTIRQNIMKTNMPKEYYVKKVCEQTDEIEKLREIIKQLEMKSSHVKESNEFDDTEFKNWTKKIDVVYEAAKKAREGFYQLQSKQKVLMHRMKLKDTAENNKKALTIVDGNRIVEGVSRIEASISRLGKQAVSQQEELNRWKARFEESEKEIKKVRAEVKESKLSNILGTYIKGKDKEIENLNLNMQLNHFYKVQNMDRNEAKNTRQMLLCSFEILERNYLVLRANKLVDKDLEEMLNKLVKMTDSSGQVKFNEHNGSSSISNSTDDGVEDDIAEIRLEEEVINDGNAIKEYKIPMKRKCITVENNNDMIKQKINDKPSASNGIQKHMKIFKQNIEKIENDDTENESNNERLSSPTHCNLNETQILSDMNLLDDVNSTFLIPCNTVNNNNNFKTRSEILKNILTDSNVNAKNGPLLTKALIKSSISGPNLLSRVASASLNKENKIRSPNKIRKSPRVPVRGITNKALNSAANFLNRQRIRSNTVSPSKFASSGRVRLNRAASMRTKK